MTKSTEPSTPSGSSETQQRRRQITSYKNTTTSPATDSRKAPQLAEPVIIDRWWKNRAHDAVYVRLAPFKEHVLIDIRVWVTGSDGITKPSKGFSCTAKHLPRLHAALANALAKARELGLLLDDGGAAGDE